MLRYEVWRRKFDASMQMAGWSDKTREGYGCGLRRFFEYLLSEAVDDLAHVTREVLEGYRAHVFYAEFKGRRLSVQTQCGRLAAVKAFFRFLYRQKVLVSNPAEGLELPRSRRPIRPQLSIQEVEALLSTPNVSTPIGLRDRAVMEVLYTTAIRNAELRHVHLDDIHRDRAQLRIRCGKGGDGRLVPLGDVALHWLLRYLEYGRPQLLERQRTPRAVTEVFLTRRGIPLTANIASRLVVVAAERAHLGPHVTPHLLRYACATHMLANGAGIRHIQELLGHRSADSTRFYARVDTTELRRVQDQFHPRSRPS